MKQKRRKTAGAKRVTSSRRGKNRARRPVTREFFASKTIEQLAKEQRVKPLTDPRVLEGGWPADEDVDEFIRVTYASRR